MKHIVTILAVAALIIFTTGCGETRVTYVETELPEWVSNPHTDGEIGGQGSALPSRGGFGETLAQAEGKARTELARSLQTNVKAALTHFFSEGGQIFGDRAENPTTNQWVEHADQLFENVGRHVNDVMLQMTHRKDIWTHPETKEMFVWVVVKEEYKADALNTAKEIARTEVKRAKISAELRSEAALQRLDAEIEKRMNPRPNGVAVAANTAQEGVSALGKSSGK